MSSAAPIRFGVQGGPFVDPDALTAHAQLVESIGYRDLFTADHIATGPSDRSDPDPFLPLVAAAAATTTLQVGTLVLNAGFYNPALLARATATLDRLSGGRFILGLGTGYAASEHDAVGIEILPPAERVTRLAELVSIVRSLVDTGAANARFGTASVDVAHLGVTALDPAQPDRPRLPLLIGGHGRRVVALAAQHADIFQFTGLTHAIDGTTSPGGFAFADVAKRARWLDEQSAGRPIERSVLIQAGPDTTIEALVPRLGLDAEVIRSSPFVLTGSVAEVVDKIGRLRDHLGITHFVVRDPLLFAPVVEEFKHA